jgi:hypothetical protein
MDVLQDLIKQFNALKPLAEKKRVTIRMRSSQQEFRYFSMHNAGATYEIGRYDSITELEDALTNWVDDPNKDVPGWESYVPEVKVPVLGDNGGADK